jgi:beta-xylosidase
MTTAPWRDPALPAATRVDDLLSRMTLEEKTAQLYGVWVGADTDGGGVAPLQSEMSSDYDWDELITLGLGQLTRSFGTAPVDPGGGGGGGGGGGARRRGASPRACVSPASAC